MIDLFLVPEFQQHAALQGSQGNGSEVPDLCPGKSVLIRWSQFTVRTNTGTQVWGTCFLYKDEQRAAFQSLVTMQIANKTWGDWVCDWPLKSLSIIESQSLINVTFFCLFVFLIPTLCLLHFCCSGATYLSVNRALTWKHVVAFLQVFRVADWANCRRNLCYLWVFVLLVHLLRIVSLGGKLQT